MELDILLTIFSGILNGIIGQALAPPPRPVQPVKEVVVVERRVEMPRHKLKVPDFVISTPGGYFAGVSSPSMDLSKARKSAVNDVVRQILSAVSATYGHQYMLLVSGNVRNPSRRIKDELSKAAKGVVLGVERMIEKSAWSYDPSGKYVYFVLVRYPEALIREMRRLSKGAKVIGSVISMKKGDLRLSLSEVNGVEVVLSSVDIKVRKVNRFAPFISYYIMKVPKGSESHYSKAFGPVKICNSSKVVRLPLSRKEKRMADYLLGSDISEDAVIKGHDEIGRRVEVTVDL